MTAYYNEHDPYAAQWLRNLIVAGHIAPGDVDERSIEDVFPSDLAGYSQCHFFSGIGGWSCALRLAGWPDDRPVWTGSCPCQPFSAAGKRASFADERHLWPAWHHLIAQCKPAVVFGEQVAAPDGYAWLDLVQTDMEGTGYAFGPVVLPAAGIGAPHGRHRTFFVAHAAEQGPLSSAFRGAHRRQEGAGTPDAESERLRSDGCLDHAERKGLERHRADKRPGGWQGQTGSTAKAGVFGSVEHAESEQAGVSRRARQRRKAGDFWSDADWIFCRDGKRRPVEPGTFPLAHGVSRRVDKLRAYGNAIVPQVASEFVKAFMDCFPIFHNGKISGKLDNETRIMR